MPRKPHKTKRRTSRRFRRKRGKINKNMIVYRPLYHNPLPAIFKTKLVASATFYTGSGGVVNSNIENFRLNTAHLPFSNATNGVTYNAITPGTFNPPGYSILLNNNLYTMCIVEGLKFEFDCSPQALGDNTNVTITPSKTVSVPSSVGNALSQPYTKQMIFMASRTSNKGDYPLKMFIRPYKFLGISKAIYDNDLGGVYSSPVNADPPNLLYLVLNWQTGDNAALVNPLECRVRITYYVKFYEFTSAALTTA